MTRISTFGQNQAMIQNMLRAQEAVADSNRRISSGKVAQDFKEMSRNVTGLLSAKSIETRFETALAGSREVAQRLEIYNSNLNSLTDVADTLREEIVKAGANNSGLTFVNIVRGLFERSVGLLNTKVDGRFIYGGTRTDTSPVTIENESDLLALPALADAFANNDTKLSAQIDEDRLIRYGILADDIATPLFNAFQRILQFHDGTLPSGAAAFAPAGPFKDPLDGNQREFLLGEIDTALQGIDVLRGIEAENGVRMQELDKIMMRQSGDLVFWRSYISDIEDVDIGEAIAKLNNDRTALEASIQVVARLNRVSLLDFI